MRKIVGKKYLLRIFIGESDRVGLKPLYKVILEKLREKEVAGATVVRGIAGFGAHSVYHSEKVLRLSRDLPVIIEVVDSEEKIKEILPELDELVQGGIITMEKVDVIVYKHKHESK
ncbi:conserved hypothetical protein [Thermosulfidibacter takaii ABI70S6]|uniref:Uncharacterized protein n=1 Tax=Thermosulfidibacter takaii (strain DSM 17441 / JCM 13301 / NBRC 103674 / ABI70S6) TaxID=1298851 RepID=A0A0S3QT98_THET7|nr:DUF190 domain-containing protein [Thermosulfidibacter takaii]BAT71556.1 conserved hypothetical protein [Thermosulfidibacter takaii ABI70S6]